MILPERCKDWAEFEAIWLGASLIEIEVKDLRPGLDRIMLPQAETGFLTVDLGIQDYLDDGRLILRFWPKGDPIDRQVVLSNTNPNEVFTVARVNAKEV